MIALTATRPRLALPGAEAIADWFAAVLLRPLEAPAIASLAAPEGGDFLIALGIELGESEAARTLLTALRAQAPEAIERQLGHAHVLLFEGVAGPRTIPLTETAYARDDAPHAAMAETLRALGVAPRTDSHEPLDHLAIELAALAEALRQDNRAIADALAARLAGWVPGLRHAVRQTARSAFHTALFILLDAFVGSLAPAHAPARAPSSGDHDA